MQINKHSLFLIIALTIIVFVGVGLTIAILYNTAFEQQREQLIATTKSQAKLIESVARFDALFSKDDHAEGSAAATVSQIRDAHLNIKGFGKTGEFLFGKREKNNIVFLLPRRFKGAFEKIDRSQPLEVGGLYAEPIQRALAGKSGTIIAHDYRGERVLAAYEPVGILNYGVVTKIDLKEIRSPFIRVGVISITVAIILIMFGAYFFIRIITPIIKGLQESEAYNRMLFETSPIGLALCRMDGSLIDVNSAYVNIIGRSIEETKQLSYFDITPEDYAEEELHQLENLATTGHYGPYEKEYFHKDGRRIPVSLLGQTIERNGEKYIWSSVEDISERSKAEHQLELGIYQLNEAQRLAKVGSWELNLVSGKLIWSDEIFRMFDIDKSKFEASYDAFLNAIHPEDRDMVNQAYSDSLLNQKPYEIVHRLQMRDGKIKYVRENCETFFDDDKPLRSVGTVQDISQLYKAEQDLKTAMTLNEHVIDASPIGISIYDETGQCIAANKAIANVVGATHEQVLAQNYHKVESWKESGLYEYATTAIENGERHRGEFEVNTTFGKHAIYDCMFVPFHQYGNQHLLLMLDDITERKKAEVELEQHRENLEELVGERTKELQDAQDELVRKGRLATLGQLTATVSHELRNPLGAMRPSLYIIEKKSDKDDETVQNAIERIDRNIERCDHTIDELLDFTRITELNQQLTRVDEWLESVLDEQILPNDICLEKEFSLKGVELTIDSDRLRRAVVNVFENACHAMMEDNKKIINIENAILGVKTTIKDERVEIIITDTGSGIADSVLDKIYEPLFSTKGFGVGLGMSTVKQIMQQHSGGIEIKTKKGKGTSVILWLPLNTNLQDVKAG